MRAVDTFVEPLGRKFYARPTEQVARELLGKVVVHRFDGIELAGRVVETEAYLGADDQAAHSYAGLTERTKVIYGPPGHAYVYFIYGMHHCLNFVAERDGAAGCVLIRALEPVAGIDAMRRRRPNVKRLADLANGPGKLTLAMGIDKSHYGADLTRGPLSVHAPRHAPAHDVAITRRIGITRSKELPLRFLIAHNECLSR